MFPQQPQQQFRTAGADVQIFMDGYGNDNTSQKSWMKPRGVSNIYIMLIGGGGNGGASTGGGSGAITVWYGSAQNVPDNLIVITINQSASSICKRFTSNALVYLLTAEGGLSGGAGGAGGAAMTANQFTASGFFQSVAGQAGSAGGITASATTFLSGGGPSGNTQSVNYGYGQSSATNLNGFFMLQPIIVGAGGIGTSKGGIGCGGGDGGTGGSGMVLIASW